MQFTEARRTQWEGRKVLRRPGVSGPCDSWVCSQSKQKARESHHLPKDLRAKASGTLCDVAKDLPSLKRTPFSARSSTLPTFQHNQPVSENLTVQGVLNVCPNLAVLQGHKHTVRSQRATEWACQKEWTVTPGEGKEKYKSNRRQREDPRDHGIPKPPGPAPVSQIFSFLCGGKYWE
jgi:hypothetical protein